MPDLKKIKTSRAGEINDLAMLFLAGFWSSESTVWPKFGPKIGPNVKFEFEYPRELIEAVNQANTSVICVKTSYYNSNKKQ